MQVLTLLTFFLFTGMVAMITWLVTRRDDHQTGAGFFLAGRRLTAPFIAGSLLLTNLSTEQMVGLNGSAFRDGLAVMVWEVVAVIALVAMALFFLPRFLLSGIATVPQYLHERFDHRTRTITDFIFLLAYAGILLPIVLYTGAVGLIEMLDIKAMLGLGETTSVLGLQVRSDTLLLWLVIWFVGLVGSCYAQFGGLRTVAVSDLLNGIGLLIGGLMITCFGLAFVGQQFGDGGMVEGLRAIQAHQGERLNSVGGRDSAVPFGTVFTGILLLNLFYWCTNQQIIQRTFGANSLKEGQKGVLLTGLLKLIGPLYLVLPGIMAYQLYAEMNIHQDRAYGMLVRDVLPWWLVGFFAAVLVGAILSSFNSALNATATLFSYGVYRPFINPAASDHHLVRSGKIAGWIIAVVAMCVAPLLAEVSGIFSYLQKMNGLYFIPIFAVVLVGMLHRRTPPIAANVALVLGLLLVAAGYFIPLGTRPDESGDMQTVYFAPGYLHEFHFLGLVFVILVALMLVITAIRPLPEPWTQRDSGDVDMTPWAGAKWSGAALCVIVVLIYLVFAGGLG